MADENDAMSPTDEDDEILIKEELSSEELFTQFVTESKDLVDVLDWFYQLCQSLDINPKNYKTVYQGLTSRLTFWKGKNLWNKLDKKAKHVDYKNKPCAKMKTVVIGAGPCGLRSAIELALLGAEVIVLEKRNSFSRNNVLHLWPFLIVDLKSLGAKVFYGKFCAGSLDHISIRKLQCILLKCCLILGVQVYPETSFDEVLEPAEGRGWRLKTSPSHAEIANLDIDAIVGADGRRNLLKGFRRKEFRGKLAIGITVNFVNKNTQEEAAIEEISGVAFIYNQQFFQELKDKTQIDLENIVYYKDDTHYFVMTAKKKSLLQKGVIKEDNADARQLLAPSNIDHSSLLVYARQAVDFSTNYKLPHHEFAVNHYGKEDVAMFDFTSMHAAENASRIVERKGRRLLMCIVGDTLIEPFWPTGSGCARGFLSAFDAAWAVRSFGLGKEPLDILQERECILKLLAQTKPGNLLTAHQKYSIDPSTRYPNLNTKGIKKESVRHLYDKSEIPFKTIDYETISKTNVAVASPKKKGRVEQNTGIDAYRLLKWCQEQTKEYPRVKIIDMAISWKNGLGFCAIIHRYRPDLLDFFDLSEYEAEKNCQLAFEVAEEQLGIPPKISAKDFTSKAVPDRLTVISYVSLYYDLFKNEMPVTDYFIEKPPARKPRVVFWNTLRAFAVVGSNNNTKTPSPAGTLETMRKSPLKANKMSIIARLSRKSKKKAKNLELRRAKDKHANKENKALNGTATRPKTSGRQEAVSPDRKGLLSEDSDTSGLSSPEPRTSPQKKEEHSSPLKKKENIQPLKTLQPFTEDTKPRSSSGIPLQSPKEDTRKPRSKSQESAFVITGVQTGESETDVIPSNPNEAKRQSKINMLAESVFGVSTKQAVAEAEANLSQSELCYFCKRRVYVMERMSAEGMFFHRQCFRCNVCKCNLLLGNYAFDADEDDNNGKFYCKLHYNRMVYDKPKQAEEKPDNVASPGRGRRARPATQIVEPKTYQQAVFAITTSKSPETSPSIDIPNEKGLRDRSLTDNEAKPRAIDHVTPKSDSPYDKFEAKPLVRQSSLTRQDSKKLSPIKDSPPMGTLKHASSSPALQKLMSEDNEFGEDLRRRSELKDDNERRRKHLRKLSPSFELKKSVEEDLIRDDSIVPGQPTSSPVAQRRLELTTDLNPTGMKETERVTEHPKKKKFVLKKKKLKTISPETIVEEKEGQFSPVKKTAPVSIGEPEFTGSRAIQETNKLSEEATQPDLKVESIPDIERSPKVGTKARHDTKPRDEKLEATKFYLHVDEGKSSEESDMVAEKELEKETDEGIVTKSEKKKEKKKKEKKKTKVKEREKKEEKKEKEKKKEKKKGKKEKNKKDDDDWVVIDAKGDEVSKEKVDGASADELRSNESEASDVEDATPKKKHGIFGTKPKRILKTAEELSEEEKKQKRKEMKKIQQAASERRLKRLWEAQSIQRKLNEVEVKQFELDERAKLLERKLRRPYLKPEEEGQLMMDWFQVVNDKNVLLRFESELVIQANSIQLEDEQARLESDIRTLLTSENPRPDDHEWIQVLTKKLVDTVEERNNLIEMLEEDRLRELEEDKNLDELMTAKAREFGMDRLI